MSDTSKVPTLEERWDEEGPIGMLPDGTLNVLQSEDELTEEDAK